jgi:hypothetical protein
MTDAVERIQALDVSIFTVKTATGQGDRLSLLRLQNLVAAQGSYAYVEVGSFLGGTLVPHLLDPRCASVLSIDLRPDEQPDERGRAYSYKGSTTARMLGILRPHVPDEGMAKLATFDGDASAYAPAEGEAYDLAFIDGEHTITACFSDYVSLRELMKPDGIIVFHDSNLVTDAIINCERDLMGRRVPCRLFFLPDNVAAIALRGSIPYAEQVLTSSEMNRAAYVRRARNARWAAVAKSVASGEHRKL